MPLAGEESSRTIHYFDGDASGAKKAGGEVAAVIQQQVSDLQALAAAEQQAAAAAQAMAEKVQNAITEESQAYEDLQAAAEEASAMTGLAGEAGGIKQLAGDFDALGSEGKKALDGIGSGAQGAKVPMESLTQLLGSASPELAALVRGANDLEKILPAVFGPGGLAFGGIIAGLSLVVVAMNSISQAAEDAKKRIEELEAASDRYQAMERAGRSDVRKELGSHGVSGEKAGAVGEQRSRDLQEFGFEKSTSDQVAAVTVAAEQAGVQLSTEDRLKLAGLASKGAIDLSVGSTPEDTAKSVTDNLKRYEELPDELQASVQAVIEQTARSRLDFLESVKKGSASSREQYLKEFGWEGEGLKTQSEGLKQELDGTSNRRSWERDQLLRQIEDARSVVDSFSGQTEGRKGTEQGVTWSDLLTPSTSELPTGTEAKRRERESLMKDLEGEALSPEEALKQKLRKLGAADSDIESALALQEQARSARSDKRSSPQLDPWEGKKSIDPDAQNRPAKVQTVQNVTNIYQSGIVNNSPRDPRFQRQSRVPTR